MVLVCLTVCHAGRRSAIRYLSFTCRMCLPPSGERHGAGPDTFAVPTRYLQTGLLTGMVRAMWRCLCMDNAGRGYPCGGCAYLAGGRWALSGGGIIAIFPLAMAAAQLEDHRCGECGVSGGSPLWCSCCHRLCWGWWLNISASAMPCPVPADHPQPVQPAGWPQNRPYLLNNKGRDDLL